MEKIKAFFGKKPDFVRPLAKRLEERQKRREKAANAPDKRDRCLPCKRCLGDVLLDCKTATMCVMQVVAMAVVLLLLGLSGSQFLANETLQNGLTLNSYPSTNISTPNATLQYTDACSQNPVLDANRPSRFKIEGSNGGYFLCPWSGKYAIWRILVCIFGLILNPVSLMMTMQNHRFQAYLTLGGKGIIALLLLVIMGVDGNQTNLSREWCLSGAPGLNFVGRNGQALDCDYSPFIATVFFDMGFIVWAVDLGLTLMYVKSWSKKIESRQFERMQNEEI